MTDLEITKACAKAMGLEVELQRIPDLVQERYELVAPYHVHGMMSAFKYDPMHDDAQCFAMVKKFRITIKPWANGVWFVFGFNDDSQTESDALNRAICECVAKMHKAKTT